MKKNYAIELEIFADEFFCYFRSSCTPNRETIIICKKKYYYFMVTNLVLLRHVHIASTEMKYANNVSNTLQSCDR